MKKIISLILISILIIVVTCVILFKKQIYSKNIFAMDTLINVKIYSRKNADKIILEIEQIYEDYHKLTDRYNHYDGVYNVYNINNNEEGFIDKRLLEILIYGSEWYSNSDELFNINMGALTTYWKEYISAAKELPKQEDLIEISKSIESLKIENGKIINQNKNIDLGAVAKGYTTRIVGNYLKGKGFTEFIINAGGQVLVGDKYKKEPYKIGIKSPINSEEMLTIINGENIGISTSGDYERYYEIDGKRYHHIIDPKTLFPADFMKSVTVIAKDGALADILTTTLFLMDIDAGKEFIKNYDVEAIWVDNDNNIIRSEGFNKYE